MSMKNIFKNILVGGVAVVMMASCDMNLLPTTQIPYDENKPLFVLDTDVEQLRNGVLASYRSLQSGSFSQSSEVMCDAFNATMGFGNNYGSVHRTDESFTTSDEYVESLWASHYSAIKNYNIVIAGALRDDVPESLRPSVDIVQGMALFCRASSYLTLARHFGPKYNPETASVDLCVPLVLKYDQYAKPARATVEDVYLQILDDLTMAEYFLENVTAEGPGAIMPTIDAVKALLARYYLDVQEYDNAVDYADAVIKSTVGYALSSTALEMQNEFTNDRGSEAIIQLYASKAEGTVASTIYTSVNNDNEGKRFDPLYLPSQKILDAYEEGDLRYVTWFTKGLYPVFMNGDRYYDVTVFVKYLGNPALQTGIVETGARAAKPLMISEMYLICAEAYAMSGDATKAKAFLNALQKARKATETDGSMENIKKEWFRETVGEGHRFICLKRWGDGFEGRPYQDGIKDLVYTGTSYDQKVMAPDAHVFNWPIPAYEMKLNRNLVQNEDYN